MLLLGGLFLLLPDLQAQNDEKFYTIRGEVKDMRTKKKIEYVTVSAVGTSVGTITNEDGEFVLKLSDTLSVSEIEFSCMGYYNTRVPVSINNPKNQVFYLTSRTISLQEIEVLGWENSIKLLEAAIEKIDKNYSLTPNMLTGFYRETAQKGRKYINISEAVIGIYKDSYKEDFERDRVRILKGRKLISPNRKDTLAVKLMGGPTLSTYLDIVKNPTVLLDKEVFAYYNYKPGETTSIDNRLQYVVHFSPKLLLPIPLYSGTFYIDQETLSFTRVEFELDMRDKEKVINFILLHKPAGLRFSPEEVSYVVSYKQQNGKTYLNYIHNEIKFKCDWKRKLFATNYTIVSEMVITDNQKENISKIPVKNSFTMRQSLSEEAMTYYDSDFWGAYNIIEPTESLESAVGKLKKE
ncbi:hypothetical protein FACS189432_00400 [Bacteroidia bacterium]|nr:hypothetical protein FACS189432_00400 [Bacteroidia bacterium]